MTEITVSPTSSPEKLTLRKSAKLRHRTLVQELFEKGKSVYSGPLRVTYRAVTAQELSDSFRRKVPDLLGPVQFMITVPKKKRRHAVDRVLMRRRIREALRLQWRQFRKMIQDDPDIRTLSIAIVYINSENNDMPAIKSALESALSKITKKIYPQPSE